MARIPETLICLTFSLALFLCVLKINADNYYINVTACPSDRLDAAISKCIWKNGNGDLLRRISIGFPWSPTALNRHSGYPGSVHHLEEKIHLGRDGGNGSVLDPMDNLDGICKNFDKASNCLGEYQTQEFCLWLDSTVFPSFTTVKTFKFICHNQTRDDNLLRSLRCLHDTRLPSMLYYHIATQCRQGMDILDQQMIARKKCELYTLNMRIKIGGGVEKLYCLPERVLSKCVHKFAEEHCGRMAANLLVSYVNYIQEEQNRALKSLGQATDLCNRNLSQERHSESHLAKMSNAKVLQYRLQTMGRGSRLSAFFVTLTSNYSDTELDTVTGRHGISVLMERSGSEICNNINCITVAYYLCVLQARDTREIPKFNILQYSHLLQRFYYHGSHCWRIGQFTQCWNALQSLCGSRTRYFAQHATLMIDGCRLQEKMDDISCHWQDFMFPAYIKASQVTQWPLHGLSDPMFLDGIPVNSLKALPDFEILWQAVDNISVRCGTEAGTYLRRILDKIRYSQYDALAFLTLPRH